MTTLTHAAVGYLIGREVLAAGILPPQAAHAVYLISMLSANGPDIDGILFPKNIHNHRLSPFHYPFTWWVIFMTVMICATAEHARWLLPYVYLAGANVLIHFILDTFAINQGIRWFGPFYKKGYSFLSLVETPKTIKEWGKHYVKHPVMWSELFVWIIGILIIPKHIP